jgi:hypothetical protein
MVGRLRIGFDMYSNHMRLAIGPLEDGLAAAKRGDYATALRLSRPLADQGDAVAQRPTAL